MTLVIYQLGVYLTNNMLLTTLQVNEKEAKLFIMMQLLESLGVFDIKSGSVTIHFDKDGKIGNVVVQKSYKLSTDL